MNFVTKLLKFFSDVSHLQKNLFITNCDNGLSQKFDVIYCDKNMKKKTQQNMLKLKKKLKIKFLF